MKVIDLKKQAKNSRFYSLVSFTRPHEKPWKRKHSSNCFVSQHFFTWEWDQKSIDFHLQWEEESDFLHAVAIQAGQKIRSNLRRKQIFVIFNDCQDMLKNVDEIIGRPFPVNGVFNQRSRRLCSGAQKVVGAGIASGTASETLCIIVILIIITDLSEAISQYLFK